jgi:hypothetical protein
MMIPERPALERRLLTALDGSVGPRIPVVLGGCGTGRTSLLLRLRDLIGRSTTQYIDVERVATTPERFLSTIRDASPFPAHPYGAANVSEGSARDAFDATLAFLDTARAVGDTPATFLLDEFLELRTFESFPGLRRVLHDLVDGLGTSGNRYVLTSRYTARALRLLRDRSARFEVLHIPPVTAEDTIDILGPTGRAGVDSEFVARTVHALADGRPSYVRALADELHQMGDQGGDAISALAALMGPEGRLSKQCNFCYELRLHRARGYGALKAILEILAEEEDLTLTEISHRLQRTPGSTKDYLSWLEDVDLVTSRQKRYSFTDALLRVWVRLHCRASAPTEDDVAREIHRYALPRLPMQPPATEPAYALVGQPSGIIEID